MLRLQRLRPGRWRLRRRRLLALQVEVSSRCTRSCRICPRSALADRWQEGDLQPELWQRLRPDLQLVEHIHLQGWGEPLLHPALQSMVRDAHRAGCTAGITSNGDLLCDAAGWIVEERVDLVSVSVAGASRRHADLRAGSSLEQVLDAVARLHRLRGRRRRPRLQLSYLLTRSSTADLAGMVEAAARAGADELIATHLDCTVSSALLEEAEFSSGGVSAELRGAVHEADRVARRTGICFRPPALHPQELLACALAPPRLAAVAWDGRVGPCVQQLLPVQGSVVRVTREGSVAVEPALFGSLRDASLREILDAEPSRRFCAPLLARHAADEQMQQSTRGLWGSEALRSLTRAEADRDAELLRHPFPPSCRGCHKMQGW